MSEPYIAIVGLGSIGSAHVNRLWEMGYRDLIGIESSLIPHEERFPVVNAFEDLGTRQPTHALICTPPEWHYHHAKYFVDRGIDTFIEKPVTVKSVEASFLCSTAHMNKSVLAVGYMERAHYAVRQASEFISQHGCSKAEICCYWRATPNTYALDTVAESSHAIDLAIFLLGKSNHTISRVTEGNEETLRTRHTCGASSVIRMNMHEWPRRVINLLGEDGMRFSVLYGDTKEEWEECYREELAAFLGGTPLCTGEDGLLVVKMLERIQ
jgi:predicted dehydrogenase